jgi:hypothetical protein
MSFIYQVPNSLVKISRFFGVPSKSISFCTLGKLSLSGYEISFKDESLNEMPLNTEFSDTSSETSVTYSLDSPEVLKQVGFIEISADSVTNLAANSAPFFLRAPLFS